MKKLLIFLLWALAIAIVSCKSADQESSRTLDLSPFAMKEAAILNEIVVEEMPISSAHKKAKKEVLRSEDISALPTKNISEIAAATAGVSVNSNGDISIRSGRPDASHYYIDGVRVNTGAGRKMVSQYIIESLQLGGTPAHYHSEELMNEIESNEELDFSEDLEVEPPRTYESELPPSAPEPGLLTAAEWNDLKNWDKWLELQESGAYQTMVDYWNLAGLKRQSVFVTNEDGNPLANQKVELVTDSRQILWSAITDNSGSAELFVAEEITEAYELVIAGGQEVYELREVTGSSTHFRVDQACLTESTIDIMFVVDATGSMQDEIDFLRAELGSVIERVEAQADEDEIRVGTVFYKDTYDDYVTAISPLDFDLNNSLEFIRSKDAGGGGDNPEAVDAALELALEQNWNSEATNRLMFLILDAPPHYNAEVLERLEKQIRKAAALGIKLIPITASGIDRETEYLMKLMAVLTNGTYIFLTDDSGIGAPHLEHVVPDYEVEFLNDLLVRVISGYAEVHNCERPITEQAVASIDLEVKVFPNPTAGRITVTTNTEVDKISVTSTSGKTLFSVDRPALSEQMDLSALISGMYQVSCVKGGRRVSAHQLIKI